MSSVDEGLLWNSALVPGIATGCSEELIKSNQMSLTDSCVALINDALRLDKVNYVIREIDNRNILTYACMYVYI